MINSLKARLQRAVRGWSDADALNMNEWFLSMLPQMLKYFREHRRGYPIELLREYLSAHRDELNMTYDEFRVWPAGKSSAEYRRRKEIDFACGRIWDETLGLMIYLLEQAGSDTPAAASPKEALEFEEYKDRCKTEALELFNKWFYNLCD